MRLRVNDTWVAGNPSHAIKDWTPMLIGAVARNAVVITESGPGWESLRFCDGGNVGLRLSFSVARLFDTEAECFEAWRDYLSGEPPHDWSGTVYLRHEQGADWQEAYSPGAMLTLTGALPQGLTLRLNYTLECGLLVPGDTGVYGVVMTEAGEAITTEDDEDITTENFL